MPIFLCIYRDGELIDAIDIEGLSFDAMQAAYEARKASQGANSWSLESDSEDR